MQHQTSSVGESSATSSNCGIPSKVGAKVFPVEILNKKYNISILHYSNRVFLNITDCGRIGNLFMVDKETPSTTTSPLVSSAPSIYKIHCLLGEEEESVCVCVRAIAEQLQLDKPLLISFTLPPPVPSVLHDLVTVIKRNL